MKKRVKMRILTVSILLALSLLSGCGTPGTNGKPEPETPKIGDYFPIIDDAEYLYEGMGNEYATYTVFVEYTGEGLIQQRVDNGGSVLARVYEVKDGKLTRLFNRGETYFRENMLDRRDGSEEVLLMEPLEAGTTWTLQDGSERTIIRMDASVETPSGTYEAIEVVSTGENESVTDFYVKDLGLVKTVFTGPGYEVSSSLKEVKEDAYRTETIRFYFPRDNDVLQMIEKEVTFRTNDDTGQILEEAYKEAGAGTAGIVLTDNTKINRMTLNQDNILEIDLNAAFRTEMNAGSAYEGMILQSVADTFGNYYGVREVILTIDGNLYASGHFEFQEGETIKVNTP